MHRFASAIPLLFILTACSTAPTPVPGPKPEADPQWRLFDVATRDSSDVQAVFDTLGQLATRWHLVMGEPAPDTGAQFAYLCGGCPYLGNFYLQVEVAKAYVYIETAIDANSGDAAEFGRFAAELDEALRARFPDRVSYPMSRPQNRKSKGNEPP